MKKFMCFLVLIVVLAIPVLAQETEVRSYVQDNANIFTPEQKQNLEAALRDFEQKTSVQYVIFTTESIPDETSLEEYSLKIAEDNKIGYEGNDNGLLFFLAVDDRQYRWETGYGIEDVLNAAYLGRVSREAMVPYFQQGDYESGIVSGSQIIMARIQGTDDEDIFARSGAAGQEEIPGSIVATIVLFILFIFVISAITKGTRKKRGFDDGELPAYMYVGAASGMFRGGFGGGGLGGFGGFSGGGGSFGGGGFGGSF